VSYDGLLTSLMIQKHSYETPISLKEKRKVWQSTPLKSCMFWHIRNAKRALCLFLFPSLIETGHFAIGPCD
jgi:hypothetical protein